ncbi:NHLP bacteriocin export ABC transporter permease/ATPase subunit [Streptomyces sp. NBC_00285]|uniref:NHLP bacteriocin export ABC transporter permease/ATPase subunit n=1 Tax=Streptomyces sp. NBC_00285 TaxID=2975700 RepID=UPI002E2D8073|nr:NHLP bacteriocin export ABC transporter permease/ATPase subunit [Streptomyces sp. NBC_00285]
MTHDRNGADAGGQGFAGPDANAVPLLPGYGQTAGPRARHVVLGGRHTLWLVSGAALNLFAVGTVERGPWQFVGRFEPGMIIMGSPREARHVLAARPEEGCVLRRVSLDELFRSPQDRSGDTVVDLQRRAISDGIDAGLTVLHSSIGGTQPSSAPVEIPPGGQVHLPAGHQARPRAGVLWIGVNRGHITTAGPDGDREHQAGDTLALTGQDWVEAATDTDLVAWPTEELLSAGQLWGCLVHHHGQYLHMLSQRIDRQWAIGNQSAAEGRDASARAVAKADQALRAVAHPVARWTPDRQIPEDAAVEVCRIVAAAAGIDMGGTSSLGSAGSRTDPITRITTASRIRTRPVRLTGTWWREDVGPLAAYLGSERMPVALLWRRGGYDIVEPGTGRRRVTAEVAADLQPSAVMFYRSLPEEPVNGFRLLRFGLHGARLDVLRLLAAGIAGFAVALVVPIATGQVLGEFVPNARNDLIVQAGIAVVIAGVVSAAFSMMNSIAVLRLEARLDATLQAAVWDRLLRLPAAFFTRYSTGELASAALGINAIRSILSNVGVTIISALLTAAVNLALLLWYSAPLGLLAATLLLLHGSVFIAIAVRQLRWQHQLIDLEYKLADRVFQTLRSLPKLRVAAAEGFAYARWAADFTKSRELTRRVERTQNLVTAINAGYVPFSTLLLFLALAGPAEGMLTLAQFLTFLTAFAAVLSSMVQVTSAISSASAVVPLFDKIRPVLEETPEVTSRKTVPERLSGELELADVSFRYSDGSPLILEKINLHVGSGEFVAIVGPTGCGKSTLLRLLIGFNQPTTGTVRYDGHNLTQLDLSEVRQQCGVVLQHAAPFAGTILSNICGTGSYTVDEAWKAAELAGLDRDIKGMPMGMHTLVTDGAAALSGGQRQRLMIARALIARPKILFFDEATSALDNETQAIVTESTRTLSATRIVIAHRLSTIMHADRVIVLDEGRITQEGSPEQLLTDQAGLFYQLVHRQIQEPLPSPHCASG